MDRSERKEQIVERLQIEEALDGTRLVTLDGAALGRLNRDETTGHWALKWHAGWHDYPTQLEGSRDEEVAELWAAEAVADMLAMERAAIDEGKPWTRADKT